MKYRFAACAWLLFCGVSFLALPGALRAETMEQKADQIIIPKLDLSDVILKDVFNLLRKRSIELDPDGTGVNFMFRLSPVGEQIFTQHTVTMALSNISLADVIRYSCMASGLKYVYEPYAIIIYDPAAAPRAAAMTTRFYDIAAGVLDSQRTRPRANPIQFGNSGTGTGSTNSGTSNTGTTYR